MDVALESFEVFNHILLVFITPFFMSLFPVAVVIVAVALIGGALALAAFFWALRTGQFSVKHMNEGALTIFDSKEPVGTPTDMTLQTPRADPDERPAKPRGAR